MSRLSRALALTLFAALSLGAAALAAGDPPATGYADARVAYCMERLAAAHARGKMTPEAPTGHEPLRPTAAQVERSQVTPPVIIYRVPPHFPDELRKANVEGRAVVETIIDEHGCVDDARVVESPELSFSTAALDAVARWVFQPAMHEGRPVRVYYTLTINFKIEHEAPRP